MTPHPHRQRHAFIRDIAYELIKGADATLRANGVTYDTVEVPGAFEIPGAIRLALDTRKI